jgi:hypothetical protein
LQLIVQQVFSKLRALFVVFSFALALTMRFVTVIQRFESTWDLRQSAVDLPWLEQMSKLLYIYSFPAKLNPFQSQACSLLVGSSAAQLYFSADTYDTMPWQLVYRISAQQTRNGAVVLRIASRGGDGAVGTYLSNWNGKYHAAKREIALLVPPQSIPQ